MEVHNDRAGTSSRTPEGVVLEWPRPGGLGQPEPEAVRWAIPGVSWGEQLPPVVVPPSPVVQALRVVAEAVSAVDPTGLSPEQAMRDAEELQAISQVLRVSGVRRLADVTARELHALRGFRSTTAWLRDSNPDTDVADAGLGRRLAGHSTLAGAVERGELSLVAARKVVAALGRCRPHVDQPDGVIDEQPGEDVVTAVVGHVVDLVAGCVLGMTDDDPRLLALHARTVEIVTTGGGQLERLEAGFVLLAEQVPPSMLSACLDELVLAVVPSILDDRAERGRDKAGLSLERTPDGSGWHLEADLDLQCGERLFIALRAEARRDTANPADTEAAALLRARGIDPWDPEVVVDGSRAWPRPRRQRLHDAFDALLGRYLEAGLGGISQKTPVQVSVTISAGLLDGTPGARPATADSGSHLPRELLRRWWCDSRVTAFVLSRGGQALRAIHLGRTLTAVQRRAANIEGGGRCAGIGCCRSGTDPTVDLRPHHVRRYADDGVTSLDDTVLICDTLHRDLHEGHKQARLRNGRHLTEAGWVS